MADHLKPDVPDLDQQLADFTDEVLSDVQPETQTTMLSENPELRDLQQTVLRFKRAFGTRQTPDEALTRRVQANLIAAWRNDPELQAEPWWQRWLRGITPRPTRRGWGPMLALVVVLIVIMATSLVVPFSPTAPGPGAAGGWAGLIPAMLILGGMLVVICIWLIRRK
jgi:hypothetical protein